MGAFSGEIDLNCLRRKSGDTSIGEVSFNDRVRGGGAQVDILDFVEGHPRLSTMSFYGSGVISNRFSVILPAIEPAAVAEESVRPLSVEEARRLHQQFQVTDGLQFVDFPFSPVAVYDAIQELHTRKRKKV